MASYKQLKVGPELLSPSAESWLAYYLFAVLALAIPGLGGYWLNSSDLEGADYVLAMIGVGILFLIAASMTVLCHCIGHIMDYLVEIRAAQDQASENPTKAPEPAKAEA